LRTRCRSSRYLEYSGSVSHGRGARDKGGADLESVKPFPAQSDSGFWPARRCPGASWMADPTGSRIEPAQAKPARLTQPRRASPLRAGDARSMRQHERKSRLLLEWDRWLQAQPVARRRPTARDTLKFFYELEDSRSPLLDFRSGRRDKWHLVHAWLVELGRVSEVVSPMRPPPRHKRVVSPPMPKKKEGSASARPEPSQAADTTAPD
jgi:hypothetical protein